MSKQALRSVWSSPDSICTSDLMQKYVKPLANTGLHLQCSQRSSFHFSRKYHVDIATIPDSVMHEQQPPLDGRNDLFNILDLCIDQELVELVKIKTMIPRLVLTSPVFCYSQAACITLCLSRMDAKLGKGMPVL